MKAAREAYVSAFEAERVREYPIVDDFERDAGFALDRGRLEDAARVLACPVKKNPPCWQHGRILYAQARRYLAGTEDYYMTFLDIGTAKGFSALCMAWALADAGHAGMVVSIDVIDPYAMVDRNSILDPMTVPELVDPWWPMSVDREFHGMPGADWLALLPRDERVHFAFVDGKHDFNAVSAEGRMLAEHQEPGDVAIFDDVHVPGVNRAVSNLPYAGQRIKVLTNRAYLLGERQ